MILLWTISARFKVRSWITSKNLSYIIYSLTSGLRCNLNSISIRISKLFENYAFSLPWSCWTRFSCCTQPHSRPQARFARANYWTSLSRKIGSPEKGILLRISAFIIHDCLIKWLHKWWQDGESWLYFSIFCWKKGVFIKCWADIWRVEPKN